MDSDEEDFYDPDFGDSASQTEEMTFDPAGVRRHSYLGEVDDVNDGLGSLEEGREYTVPSISRPGVVLFPGMMLPLKAVHAAELGSLEKALSVPLPLKGFLVIEPSTSAATLSRSVGCLARIRQVGRDEGRLHSVIAQGRQRVNVLADLVFFDQTTQSPLRLARIEVLPQECVPCIPPEIREGYGHWAPWVVHQMDPYFLADLAYSQVSRILPNVKDLREDPCLFSYWLAASLPICCNSRQILLTEDNVSYRLRKELQLISSVSGIFCASCSERLANVTDVIAMSEVGPSDVFVNAHGYVHDLITVRNVQSIKLHGSPQQEHSWFDGFAWTLAHCSSCFAHIGWRFTAVEARLHPHCFWGLSRARITHEAPQEDE